MGSMNFVVFNPTSGPTAKEMLMAKRPDTLKYGVLGIINNGKTNSDTVLTQIANRLQDQYNLKEIVYLKKYSFSHPIREAEAEKLAKQCDFVIAGIGD
jgi:hypothetical protein